MRNFDPIFAERFGRSFGESDRSFGVRPNSILGGSVVHYSLHVIFGKNFVKLTFLLKKLLNSWFDEIFLDESKFFIFPHGEFQTTWKFCQNTNIFLRVLFAFVNLPFSSFQPFLPLKEYFVGRFQVLLKINLFEGI